MTARPDDVTLREMSVERLQQRIYNGIDTLRGFSASPCVDLESLMAAVNELCARDARRASDARAPEDGDVLWRLNEAERVTLSDMLRLVRGWTSAEAVADDAERLLASLKAAPADVPAIPASAVLTITGVVRATSGGAVLVPVPGDEPVRAYLVLASAVRVSGPAPEDGT